MLITVMSLELYFSVIKTCSQTNPNNLNNKDKFKKPHTNLHTVLILMTKDIYR